MLTELFFALELRAATPGSNADDKGQAPYNSRSEAQIAPEKMYFREEEFSISVAPNKLIGYKMGRQEEKPAPLNLQRYVTKNSPRGCKREFTAAFLRGVV